MGEYWYVSEYPMTTDLTIIQLFGTELGNVTIVGDFHLIFLCVHMLGDLNFILLCVHMLGDLNFVSFLCPYVGGFET